ncbi:hypothetical protein Syun_005305 [Stephania yunnanensis]|uniref:NAC domain-containing protein n=1 Tax=Stephania yunnanensis TaxID=152371 RepID=A0AAP0L601_9MAGN
MESMEPSVPPGFRFHPTDEELVGYYLKKKIASQKIDLDVIRDIDLYRIEPWDLQDRCRIGYEEQNEWYFFSHKDKKYPTGTRTNRATMAGFWKATGRDKAVYDKSRLIGMRKTLVFYRGRAPNGQKSDWIMHEYRLESDENGPPQLLQEEGWVVCRAFKKRATSTSQTRASEGWDSSYFYDELSGTMSSIVDPSPINFIHRQHDHHHHQQQQRQHRFLCKQEIEAAQENFNFLHSTDHQFVQLPQLESPSLPLLKRPSLLSVVLDNNSNNTNEDEEQIIRGRNNNSNYNAEKVTDWRALDKFVASQLSQEERFDGSLRDHNHHNNNSKESDDQTNADMALLLLQGNGEDEGEKLKGFLASTSDCDIGICIFDKV